MARAEIRLWPIANSPSELCARLGIPRRTLAQWCKGGRDGPLPVFKIGTRRKILTSDAVAYIHANLATVELEK